MQNDLLYRIALTLVPHIGAVQARILIQHFGDAAAVFKAKKSMLGRLQGIGEIRASSILHFNRWEEAEKEIAFIARYKITPLFITDAQYPSRLLNCYDPPTLLYYRGSAPLNAKRVIAVVGTRYKTEYGKQLAETLLRELSAQEGLVVVSGLALGSAVWGFVASNTGVQFTLTFAAIALTAGLLLSPWYRLQLPTNS